MTIPRIFPLNIEVGQNSKPKAETDHLSFDFLMPAQMASTQTEKAAYQMTEEEDAQFWDSSLDVDCPKQDPGADEVSMSSTHKHIGVPFILFVQATGDKDKYTTFMVIQQVYRGSQEEHPRKKAHRREMKFDPYLPIKRKCPKLFEVEDQINLVLQLYDEGAESRRNNFDGPSVGQFFNIYAV